MDEGIIEKYCKTPGCGRLIAVRSIYETPKRGGRFNRVQYCPECAKVRAEASKKEWQRGNRRDCRVVNKALKKQNATLKRETAALMERVEILEAENQDLRIAARQVGRDTKQRGGFLEMLLGGT